jgi:NDP-sugar pyrophosphorylase family protein
MILAYANIEGTHPQIKQVATLDHDGNLYLDGTSTFDAQSTFNKDVNMKNNLNVDGTLTVNVLNVRNLEIDYGQLGIVGDAVFENNMEVYGESTFYELATFENDVKINGETYIGGTAYISNLGISGNLDVNGNLNVGNGAMTVLKNGNTQIGGTLGVTGISTFGGTAIFENNVKFNKDVDIDGTLTVNILNVENLELDFGQLGVYGPAYFNSNLGVCGNFLVLGGTSYFKNDVEIGNNLLVGGTSQFQKNVGMSGNLFVKGNIISNSDATINTLTLGLGGTSSINGLQDPYSIALGYQALYKGFNRRFK